MGGKGSGRPTKEQAIVRDISRSNTGVPVGERQGIPVLTPIATDIVLPNHSGVTTSQELIDYIDNEISSNAWLQSVDQTGLTGDKEGMFDLTTLGEINVFNSTDEGISLYSDGSNSYVESLQNSLRLLTTRSGDTIRLIVNNDTKIEVENSLIEIFDDVDMKLNDLINVKDIDCSTIDADTGTIATVESDYIYNTYLIDTDELTTNSLANGGTQIDIGDDVDMNDYEFLTTTDYTFNLPTSGTKMTITERDIISGLVTVPLLDFNDGGIDLGLGGLSKQMYILSDTTTDQSLITFSNSDASKTANIQYTPNSDALGFLQALYYQFDNEIRVGDNIKIQWGSGEDVWAYYDGTDFRLETNFVAASDFKIECGSNKTVELQNTVYEDQQVNLGAVGFGASAPTWTAYKSSEVLAFANNQSNEITFNLQYSHKIKTGTTTEFHIHVVPPDNNSGDVRWQLTVSYANVGSTFGAASTATATQTISANSQDTHLAFQVDSSFASSTNISGIALCSLTRLGSDAADTYANDIYLIGLDSHFEVDTMGSRQITTK